MTQVPVFMIGETFNAHISTQENYACEGRTGVYVGEFADVRKTIDSRWHGCYTEMRQIFQDSIIRSLVPLDAIQDSQYTKVLVFSSGPMGAGKSYTMRWMIRTGAIPEKLLSVSIDPDLIRRQLPEWPIYVKNNPITAGSLTHLESTLIAEIAREVAMRSGLSVWVDGSLANTEWTIADITRIRSRFPDYSICVLHVTADENKIMERCCKRAGETGRFVPVERIKRSMEGSSETIRHLQAPLVDIVAVIRNDGTDPSVERIFYREGESEPSWSSIRSYFDSLRKPYET
jgi:hypothetical protein